MDFLDFCEKSGILHFFDFLTLGVARGGPEGGRKGAEKGPPGISGKPKKQETVTASRNANQYQRTYNK